MSLNHRGVTRDHGDIKNRLDDGGGCGDWHHLGRKRLSARKASRLAFVQSNAVGRAKRTANGGDAGDGEATSASLQLRTGSTKQLSDGSSCNRRYDFRHD